MKINKAYTIIEERLSNGSKNSEKKVYRQLLGALGNLQERNLTTEELKSVEDFLDRLRLYEVDGISVRELRSRKNLFMKQVIEALSLVPEEHYLTLGVGLGAAFGSVFGSVIMVFVGIPEGASGTGLGIGIGIAVGYLVACYLEIEARKENRVLVTRTS